MKLVFGWTPKHSDTSKLSEFFDLTHADATVDPTGGYGGEPGISGSSMNAYAIKYFRRTPKTQEKIALKAKIRIGALPDTDKILVGATTATGSIIAAIAILGDGRIAAYKGNFAGLLAVSPDPIEVDTDVDIGMQTTLGAGADGSTELFIDNEQVAVQSGVDPGVAAWQGWYVGAGPDIVVNNVAGIDTASTASGTTASGSGVSGGTGISSVTSTPPSVSVEVRRATNTNLDDITPDGDTTVEIFSSVGSRITSTLQSGNAHRTILGIQIIAVAKGNKGYAPLLTVDGTTFVRGRQQLVAGEYKSFDQVEPVNPKTGLPWTNADIDALIVGGELQE